MDFIIALTGPVAEITMQVDRYSAEIGLALLLVLLVGFVLERFPPVVVAISGAAAALLLGLADGEDLLGVFSNSAPIAIGALFVISGALVRTGAVEALIAVLTRRAADRPRTVLAELFAGTFGASGFVNNTPVVMILTPVLRRLAPTFRISATKLLIPLSYISIVGGTLTLIGTSTNLLVAGMVEELGLAPFGIFEITGVGIITALGAVIALSVLGPFLLPDRPDLEAEEDEGHLSRSELTVTPDSRVVGLTLSSVGSQSPGRVRVTGVCRSGELVTENFGELVLQPGDQLQVEASPHELGALAAGTDFRVGIGGLRGGEVLSKGRRPPEVKLLEATVAPSHPSIGRALAELPMLANLPIRILGISRPWQALGPAFANARIRPADRILIAAGPDEVRAVRDNPHVFGVTPITRTPFRRAKAPIAVAALIGTILLAALNLLPIALAAIIGVAVILVARCIDPEEAWQSIDGSVLVLIFAMLAVGAALQDAGSVDLIVSAISPWLLQVHFFVLLLAVYGLTSFLTEVVTNNAVAVLMTPLVIELAGQVGADPRPLVVAVMFAASASFATPVGYQTNTIVYAAGNYRFADFAKIGIPMNILVGLFACAGIYWLY